MIVGRIGCGRAARGDARTCEVSHTRRAAGGRSLKPYRGPPMMGGDFSSRNTALRAPVCQSSESSLVAACVLPPTPQDLEYTHVKIRRILCDKWQRALFLLGYTDVS